MACRCIRTSDAAARRWRGARRRRRLRFTSHGVTTGGKRVACRAAEHAAGERAGDRTEARLGGPADSRTGAATAVGGGGGPAEARTRGHQGTTSRLGDRRAADAAAAAQVRVRVGLGSGLRLGLGFGLGLANPKPNPNLPSHAPLMSEIVEIAGDRTEPKPLGRSQQIAAAGLRPVAARGRSRQVAAASLRPTPCASLQPTAEAEENDENAPPVAQHVQAKQRRKPGKGLANVGRKAAAGGTRRGPLGVPANLALVDRTNRQAAERIAVRI